MMHDIAHGHLSNLDKILEKYSEYTSNNKYVYTSCNIEWIIILEKTIDTICDENNFDIKNHFFAKYKGMNFRVIDIISKFNSIKLNQITDNFSKITYTTETIIQNKYINYYKIIDVAYYHDIHLSKNYTGKSKIFHNNGNMEHKGYYKNGKKTNTWIYFWPNKQIKAYGNYNNDNKIGNWIYYNCHGIETNIDCVDNNICNKIKKNIRCISV